MRFVIFQINTDFLIKIFLHKTTYASPLFQKRKMEWSPSQIFVETENKKRALAISTRLKQSSFSIFSLFLKVGEVCNVPNKCWFPNKSVNRILLHKASYNTTQSCAVDRRRSQKGQLFTIFLPNLIENEVCNISNKYRSCKSLRTY